jgi:hypothetical protein
LAGSPPVVARASEAIELLAEPNAHSDTAGGAKTEDDEVAVVDHRQPPISMGLPVVLLAPKDRSALH